MLTAPAIITIRHIAKADPKATPTDVAFIDRMLRVLSGRKQLSGVQVAELFQLSKRHFNRLQREGAIPLSPVRSTRTRTWYDYDEAVEAAANYMEGKKP